jgi:hypothetical protein
MTRRKMAGPAIVLPRAPWSDGEEVEEVVHTATLRLFMNSRDASRASAVRESRRHPALLRSRPADAAAHARRTAAGPPSARPACARRFRAAPQARLTRPPRSPRARHTSRTETGTRTRMQHKQRIRTA